jgi:hypothetical protein
LAAADLLDKRASEASPGPWFYNGYSYVGSGPKSAAYNDWEFGDHTLEREGLCELCGQWREPIACLPDWKWPRGHGCKLFDVDYDMDSEVVTVRSHHGDTAVRQRAADAEWIATMHPEVGKTLAKVLRERGLYAQGSVGNDTDPNYHEDCDGVIGDPEEPYRCKCFDDLLSLADALLAGEAK